MSGWVIATAIIISFLLGGFLVAELLRRREDARRGMPWVDNEPSGPDRLSSD